MVSKIGTEGNDTITWTESAATLNGGAGDDVLTGSAYNDVLNGGAGNDTLNGGAGDDVLNGQDGNDWLSGDRGSDTITGGTGADTFHGFSGIGLDIITDFTSSQGDKIQLDAGTTFHATQVGGDLVIDLGNGDEMVLRGVTLASLPTGWIFTL